MWLHSRLTALAVSVILASGCGSSTNTAPTPPVVTPPIVSPPADSRVEIRGRVLDFASNQGLAGLAVSFGDAQAKTSADGFYSVRVEPGASYKVLVEGETREDTVIVRGPAFVGDYLAHAGPYCASRYGVVLDQVTGKPMLGVTIAGPGGGDAFTTTDVNGWYRFDPMNDCQFSPGNTVWLEASAPGHATAIFSTGRGFGGIRRTDLELKRSN